MILDFYFLMVIDNINNLLNFFRFDGVPNFAFMMVIYNIDNQFDFNERFWWMVADIQYLFLIFNDEVFYFM